MEQRSSLEHYFLIGKLGSLWICCKTMFRQFHAVHICIYMLLLGLYCTSQSRKTTVTEMISSHTLTLETRHSLTSMTENAQGDPRASRKTGWIIYRENTHRHLAAAAIAEKPPAHPNWALPSNHSCLLC